MFDGEQVTQSIELSKLAKALSEVQGKMRPAKKDATNPFFNSRYATLESCVESVRELLATHGLSVTQTFSPGVAPPVVAISTRLLHSSGEWVAGVLVMQAPQILSSADDRGRPH